MDGSCETEWFYSSRYQDCFKYRRSRLTETAWISFLVPSLCQAHIISWLKSVSCYRRSLCCHQHIAVKVTSASTLQFTAFTKLSKRTKIPHLLPKKKKVLLSQRNTFQTKFRRMPCWRPYFFFRTFICLLQGSPSRAKAKLYSSPGAWERSSSIGLLWLCLLCLLWSLVRLP
jgi:hypothetical protein